MNNQIAIILLQEKIDMDWQKLIHVLRADWGDNFLVGNDFENHDDIITFNSKNLICSISEMLAPVPANDLEFSMNTAFYWPTAKQDIASHQNHLLVTIMGEEKMVKIAEKLTQLTISLLKTINAIGVYWPSSEQVIFPDLFFNWTNSLRDNIWPIALWIKTTGYQNEDRSFYLYTIGLETFGQHELEIEHFEGDPTHGINFLLNISGYVLAKGPILKDGDSLGYSAEKTALVRYKKSSLHSNKDVIAISLIDQM